MYDFQHKILFCNKESKELIMKTLKEMGIMIKERGLYRGIVSFRPLRTAWAA